jgi:carbon-monoxide dehydrogenase small subunit
MLMTAADLLAEAEPSTREEIRVFMSGNFCRCTGYHAIIDAIETTMLERAKGHS